MALWQSKSVVTCQKGGTTGKINAITKDSATSVFEESDHSNPIKPVPGSYFRKKFSICSDARRTLPVPHLSVKNSQCWNNG